MRSMVATLLALCALAAPALAQDRAGARGSASVFTGRPCSPYAYRPFPTRVHFGDTHVHSALSADAGGSGTRQTPRDAYRLARGEEVISNTGQPIRLSRPYDFFMRTEHSDAMGAILDIIEGAPNIMADADGRHFHEAFNAGGDVATHAMWRLIGEFAQGTISPTLN